MRVPRDAEVLSLRERPEASRAARIAAIESAFAEMARGTGRMAERLSLVTDVDPQAPRPRSFELYAAVLQQPGVIGSLTYPAGYGRPLDLRIQVCAGETGRLLALVEGESSTPGRPAGGDAAGCLGPGRRRPGAEPRRSRGVADPAGRGCDRAWAPAGRCGGTGHRRRGRPADA